MHRPLVTALITSLLLSLSSIATAQIYKYKDKQGKWHFSDKPITEQQSRDKFQAGQSRQQPVIRQSKASESAADVDPGHDLKQALEQKYHPGSAIERVTLAVVSIETPLSVGSGFFITDDGYILTNRHVVKPTEFDNWKKTSKKLATAAENLKKSDKWLKTENARLAQMDKDLQAYKLRIDEETNESLRRVAVSDYTILIDRYRSWKTEYDRVRKQYKLDRSKYNSEYSKFRIKTNAAKSARSFKVILKDDTELQARLVALSPDSDLALLKVSGYRTPYLQDHKKRPAQGSGVYAVGSPLGLRDYVTSGIITQVKSDSIITDTQILPGNSGGPLVTENGEVIGINTLKLSNKAVSSEGFGIAIPLRKARDSFSSQLPEH